jgi:hypothetical protein
MQNEKSQEAQARKEQFVIQVDGHAIKVSEGTLSGEAILGLVDKRSCRYGLVRLLPRNEEKEVAPQDRVDVSEQGADRFRTYQKERVTITVKGTAFEIAAGNHSVADILGLMGESVDAYDLLEEKSGPPMPVPPSEPVFIEGCEVFHTQVKSGGSS